MPIYEYQCGRCGHQLECLQNINDAPLLNCPKCQQAALSKLISNTSFQLKGTGWYKTDYAPKPSGGSAQESTTTAATTEKSTGAEASSAATESSSPKQPAATTPKSSDTKTE